MIVVLFLFPRFIQAEATFSLPGEAGCAELLELLNANLQAQGVMGFTSRKRCHCNHCTFCVNLKAIFSRRANMPCNCNVSVFNRLLITVG